MQGDVAPKIGSHRRGALETGHMVICQNLVIEMDARFPYEGFPIPCTRTDRIKIHRRFFLSSTLYGKVYSRDSLGRTALGTFVFWRFVISRWRISVPSIPPRGARNFRSDICQRQTVSSEKVEQKEENNQVVERQNKGWVRNQTHQALARCQTPVASDSSDAGLPTGLTHWLPQMPAVLVPAGPVHGSPR
jgi:hypothetical protein